MHTPEHIKNMPQDEMLSLFCQLAEEHIGSSRWQTALAEEFDVQRVTVNKWVSGSVRVPAWAVLLLEAWIELQKVEKIKGHLREIQDFVRPK